MCVCTLGPIGQAQEWRTRRVVSGRVGLLAVPAPAQHAGGQPVGKEEARAKRSGQRRPGWGLGVGLAANLLCARPGDSRVARQSLPSVHRLGGGLRQRECRSHGAGDEHQAMWPSGGAGGTGSLRARWPAASQGHLAAGRGRREAALLEGLAPRAGGPWAGEAGRRGAVRIGPRDWEAPRLTRV